MPHPETPHPTPQNHHSPNASPNGTAQQTADLTKRCACAVKSSSTLQHLTFSHDSSLFDLFDTNLTRHVFIRNPLPKASPNGSGLSALLRTAADGCEQLRTVANAETTRREQGSTPQTPRVKREPFATHSGKNNSEVDQGTLHGRVCQQYPCATTYASLSADNI